ncbi:hypothetical protein P3W45_000174 [Vairimorpha bombi]|jgi:transcription factor STE12
MLNKDKDLFGFLSNAPKEFREGEQIKKYQMKNGDFIHCVLWNMHFYLTGTDIVKILLYRFQTSGRQLTNLKKFEEGIFSDLRNLKPGIDATLEGPRSEFLEFLYKNGCIRTQKKQKVFYWYSVPHDALFCDAMERDMRRETHMISYNKYVSSMGRMNSPINFTNVGRMSTPSLEVENMQNRNMHYQNVDHGHPHNYNSRSDPMAIFDSGSNAGFVQPKFVQENSRHTPSATLKVYPEYDDFEHDAFYREETSKGMVDNFYVTSNQKQIAPSDINKPQHRKNNSLEGFDFLKERIESRAREESERKKKSRKPYFKEEDSKFYKKF